MQNAEKTGTCGEDADDALRSTLTEWIVRYGDGWGDGHVADWDTMRFWGVATVRGFLELAPSSGSRTTRLLYRATPRGMEFIRNDI